MDSLSTLCVLDFVATLSVPILFAFALILAPTGIWKMGSRLKKSDQIKNDVDDFQENELSKITEIFLSGFDKEELKKSEPSYQLQKIQAAINYTIVRHDWYESQRSGLITKLLTLVGLGFTVLSLYVGQHKTGLNSEAILIILSTGLTLMIALLFGIHLYNSELDQDRPYRLVSDIRHWYFRYSLPDKAKRYEERMDYHKMAKNVLAERENYLDRILEISELKKSVREDFEQLFILHVLNRYKSESLNKIRWLFFATAATIAIAAVWYFTYFSILR